MPSLEVKSPVKTEKKVATHPKVSIMVDEAIKNLAEPKGSSLQAIKKYINSNYSVDIQKLSIFIKKYLKASVEQGDLVQPKGKGATGSFKINKQKGDVKSKVLKVKPPKPRQMLTSTPAKDSKTKKARTKSPNKSPVKKMKLSDLEVVPADATFSKPKTKGKKARVSFPTKPRKSVNSLTKKVKPKKLTAKKTVGKVPASPIGKSDDKSPKLAKTKHQTSKASKPKKSPIPKKTSSKKASAKDGKK